MQRANSKINRRCCRPLDICNDPGRLHLFRYRALDRGSSQNTRILKKHHSSFIKIRFPCEILFPSIVATAKLKRLLGRHTLMRGIIGLICLILGTVATVKLFTAPPAKRTGNEAYDRGYRAGGYIAPVVMFGLAGWLLLRGGARSSTTNPRRGVTGGPLPPVAPPVPVTVPVKINCGCGQHYAFDVEPVRGQMPGPVACPACGADGTTAANAVIAETLAARAQSIASAQMAQGRFVRRWHPAVWVAVGALGLVVLFLIASVAMGLMRRHGSFREVSGPSPGAPARPGIAGPTASSPGTSRERRAVRSSKPGSAAEAAPVPADVTAVDVWWGNRWWPATILKREGERALIHYEGWGSASDEWVTAERMKPRR